MSNSNNNQATPGFTNPLQTNNTALMIAGYAAGIIAAKFPIFDVATWNYIFLSVAGLIFTVGTVVLNRKSAVIATTANLPEVKNVDLDKTVQGASALANVTLANVNNVVAK